MAGNEGKILVHAGPMRELVEKLAKNPRYQKEFDGRTCPRCGTILCSYNSGPHCYPCQDRARRVPEFPEDKPPFPPSLAKETILWGQCSYCKDGFEVIRKRNSFHVLSGAAKPNKNGDFIHKCGRRVKIFRW